MRMLMKCQVPISNGFDLISASRKCYRIRRWQCSWLLKEQGENVVAAFFSLGTAIKTKRAFKEKLSYTDGSLKENSGGWNSEREN